MNKTYSELKHLHTFEERYEYLKLGGTVGHATFGFDRHLNQQFYHSYAWKSIRRYVIIRDHGCDLGVLGYEIHVELLIHHINQVQPQDLINNEEWLTDPEFLITTTHNTHNAIHYGDSSFLTPPVRERTPGDTNLW